MRHTKIRNCLSKNLMWSASRATCSSATCLVANSELILTMPQANSLQEEQWTGSVSQIDRRIRLHMPVYPGKNSKSEDCMRARGCDNPADDICSDFEGNQEKRPSKKSERKWDKELERIAGGWRHPDHGLTRFEGEE